MALILPNQIKASLVQITATYYVFIIVSNFSF